MNTEFLINPDLNGFADQDSNTISWVKSPSSGIERKMLERIGGEVACATSVVRYLPESEFASHVHEGGEEFYVLDGIFSDEHGDYPAGTYIRNPPGSRHKPFSKPGCTIFVKLRQMLLPEHQRCRAYVDWSIHSSDSQVASTIVLFENDAEQVLVESIQPHSNTEINTNQGVVEIFVLSGKFYMNSKCFGQGHWLRLPKSEATTLNVHDEETVIFIKYWRCKR